MKTPHLIVIFFLFFSGIKSLAQDKPESLTNFKIIVKNIPDGIKMKCIKGCAWRELTFDLTNYVPQAIDEYGMTKVNRPAVEQDDQLPNFLFCLTKTQDGIKLNGLKGTAWIELTFTLPRNNEQYFDQSGTREKE